MKKLKTFIYIDGFNLYYRLKHTPCRWLNLQKLSEAYLTSEKHKIMQIKYFTALVKGTLEDRLNITRQHIYLRALNTIPNLEIIFGQFKKRQVTGLKCHYENGQYVEGNELVTISKWEEKESDVNIATHIVADVDQYDCAILISNDTDLKTPLKYVKENFKKRIGIISPRRNIHIDLRDASHFQKRISNNVLKQCQFPEKMKDEKGEFFCPPKWKQNS
ncbi:MAG: NYN domain-containing protein [Bdellovibrionales bacterium]|nr:NYN domain-containing protein [Bdellovibrionales bacterium]